jgi:hypothetical protein
MNTAFQKTERIKSVFLDAQIFYAEHNNMEALIEYLENIETDFRSIAYESASMAIALKDFKTGRFPGDWLFFAKGPSMPHEAQVYIGLGWAIAKLKVCFLTAVKNLDSRLYFRIADGCGYYDGSFRHRQTVISRQIPVYLPASVMPMYDQGIGRSIWYTAKADINNICAIVETFPANRHADLWRGVGIAVAYVGGCNDDDLKTLLQHAATNRVQLACGAALAAKSRIMANTMTADTDRCSLLWFTLTAGEVKTVSSYPIVIAVDRNELTYFNWVTQIEVWLSNSFKKEITGIA